ncbi:alanine racemase [Idiomarina fontislapidosi]|uniref:Alanine racemase n=2 Tax=Idiomarina fontislapidosi TaxID=263723 RepID=A0A432XNZ5_9GAMM|nr:alanine racemase [Idiomarina fontislapidosi]
MFAIIYLFELWIACMSQPYRQTRARILLTNLRDNAKQLKSYIDQQPMLGVIKADGYGHGATEVAHAIADYVEKYAVAFIDEAIALREAGITKPIVILQGLYSTEDWLICAEQHFEPVIHNAQQIDFLTQVTADTRCVNVWLKQDSGMHRLGFFIDDVPTAVKRLREHPLVNDIVLMTHFAEADDPESPMTPMQLERFYAALHAVHEQIQGVSVANSAFMLGDDVLDAMGLTKWFRAGIALYGQNPSQAELSDAELLKPTMVLEAPVIALRTIQAGETVGYGSRWRAQRESLIATLAIGYADGYPRSVPDGTPVIINDQVGCLVGRISMDMITVDVTDIEGVKLGDNVELWGERLPIQVIADQARTITYELFAQVTRRVPRRYED